MKNEIKNIIDELCVIDPELRKYEDKLALIIEKFVAAKPDTKFDEEFARNLKAKILSEPLALKPAQGSLLTSLFNMKRNYLIYSGAAMAVLLIALVSIQTMNIKIKSPASESTNLAGAGGVIKLADRAFGSLSGGGNGVAVAENGSAFSTSANLSATGRGGGGGGAISAPMAGPVATEVASPDAKMMIYRPYQLKYVYKGTELELKDKTLNVMRRVKPQVNTSDAANLLSRLSFGGLNLSSFSGSQVTNFELSQPSADGYVLNVNLRDGMISINQNYFAANPCPGGICPTVEPLRPSEMPADEEVVKISNKFLKDHGVSLADYGEPKVENDWRKALEISSTLFAPYVPDVLSIVYPNMIDGKQVYELGGGVSGLRVNVDVRKKVVTGAWSIMNQKFESSAYEAETDSARILKFAENGGIYNGGYADSNVEIVEVELGTPSRVYANMWKSDGSGEVIVPALYFPVVKAPQGNQYYIQNGIVIPLVKELLNVPDQSPIQLMKGAVNVTEPAPAKVE